MCGIVGYIGSGNALPILINSLKRLEYRGYDSAGIACQNGKGIEIYKTIGKIKDLQGIIPSHLADVCTGIGHTRWATHGIPSTHNAHPHSAGGVVVVHNGIIENYRELKSDLVAEGSEFFSDTDTEVIPHMIWRMLKRGLPFFEAVKEVIPRLTGSFALGIMSETDPHTIYAVRKGSPLVVGYGEQEFFIASDIPAILPYTKKYIFLENDQLCTLTQQGIEITSLNGRGSVPFRDRIVEVDWSPSMAEKEGYDHFMLKEIYEQPAALHDTIGEWIDRPEKLLEELKLNIPMTIRLGSIHLVACGTSYHAALIAHHMIRNLARIPVHVEIASEYRYSNPIIEHGNLFIAITQSGETADTLAAQREAKSRHAKILTICNVVGSTSAREADSVLYTRAGPEIGVASTKAFTSQVAALCLLAIGLSIRRGVMSMSETKALRTQLAKIPELMEKTLMKNEKVRHIAHTLLQAKDCLYLGRGLNFPIAIEGALKMKEVSYIHAEGCPAGELKHGPIALIEEGLPVIVVAPVNDLFDKILSNIEEVKARGARVIAVTDEPERLMNKADDVIEIPATHPLLSPFLSVIPLQLLAYHTAVLKGCDVDQPRNLAKSVTVE
ncbi:MAG: glutamine--fructose-6-phosphate transaminase (isomerizing) [Nitrospirota bacterium]|nr:glutamine--fructose-6-phosphate transaminase (isomerizing) [Nitrospirota bacterium]